MNKRILLVVGTLALSSCGEAADGYRFERKEYERAQPSITIVTHPSLSDLRAKAPAAAVVGEGRELMVWSIIYPNGCEVHVVDPKVSYEPQWIGHEVAHCVWGRWHP